MTPAPDELDALVSRLSARTRCPECDDAKGWWVHPHMWTGEPEQVQCQTCDEYAFLLAQLEAAKRDSARLDWLEAQGNGDQWIARVSANGRGFRLHNTVGQPNKSPTARAAIDAARSSTGGPDNAD